MDTLRRLLFGVIMGVLGLVPAVPFGAKAIEPWGTQTSGVLDPNMPYKAKKLNPVTYDIDYCVVVTAPYHTKALKVWLPLPQSDAGQEVQEAEITTFPKHVKPQINTEKVFGNKFAYFEFSHPEGAQIIRHKFRAKVWELRWDLDFAKVQRVEKWPAGFDRYLKSDKAVVVDDRFQMQLKEIVGTGNGAAQDLSDVMDWLQSNMKYDHSRASLKASSEHALENRTGHCSDYHGLCAAFGRALGLPTRVAYGLNTFPKNSPSHCKLEAFLAPYGWVAFDLSDTQKMVKEIQASKDLNLEQKTALVRAATDRLRQGFRDNTWLLQTRGTDYELVPKASERVNVVRTIYAEADGKALPDPDPADATRREFAWMTSIDFAADRRVTYPFKDWSSLEAAAR